MKKTKSCGRDQEKASLTRRVPFCCEPQTKGLRAWATDAEHQPTSRTRISNFAVVGILGPNAASGDQVPEGFYELDWFNPRAISSEPSHQLSERFDRILVA